MPQMEENLNESPCSTSLKERRKPHAISTKPRWLRVSAGTRETQHQGATGNAKNPRAQKTHCCSPGSARRLLVPDEPGTPSAPQTCQQGPAPATARRNVTLHLFGGRSERRRETISRPILSRIYWHCCTRFPDERSQVARFARPSFPTFSTSDTRS